MMIKLNPPRIIIAVLLFGLFFTGLYAQPKEMSFPFVRSSVLIEKNILFSDTSTACFISFKVFYDDLFFVRNGSKYSSGLTLDIDIINDNKIIDRKSVHKDVTVSSYDSTKSETDFIQGLIKINISKEDYVLKPYSSFTNSDQNIPLDTIPIHWKLFLKEKIGRPIVIDGAKVSCGGNQEFQPVNFLGSIPYSPHSYDLLIPVLDNGIDELNVKVEEDGKEIVNKQVKDFYSNAFSEEECEGSLVVKKENGKKDVKYFHLKGINLPLVEGNAQVIISGKDTSKARFNFQVIWHGKPKTLMNPEIAIQVLRAIENESIVDSLLSFSKKEYEKVLDKYWDDKFPNRKISFNQLKDEFYKRADYAMKNFSSVTNQIGAKSDRGIVYICYGKPDDIKRIYLSENAVTEIWEYKTLKKIFSFTDKTGLGNYTRDQ